MFRRGDADRHAKRPARDRNAFRGRLSARTGFGKRHHCGAAGGATVRNTDRPLRQLTLRAETSAATELINVTAEHPFYLAGQGWRRAADLSAGDTLVASSGTVDVIGNVETGRRETVFNLEVEEFHTYFVGGLEVWAHNQCDPTKPTDVTESEATAPDDSAHIEIRRWRDEHQITTLRVAEGAERRPVVDTVAQALAEAGVAENDVVVVSPDAVPKETLSRMRFASSDSLVREALRRLQLESSSGEDTPDGYPTRQVGGFFEPKVLAVHPWSMHTPEFVENPSALLALFRTLNPFFHGRFARFLEEKRDAGERVASWDEFEAAGVDPDILRRSMKRHGVGAPRLDGRWLVLPAIDLNAAILPAYLSQREHGCCTKRNGTTKRTAGR